MKLFDWLDHREREKITNDKVIVLNVYDGELLEQSEIDNRIRIKNESELEPILDELEKL